jgi:aminoglycoside 3-N-acetyltransferase
MLYPSSKIREHLRTLGIKPNDTIFVHGDAAIAAQYIYTNNADPVIDFFREIKNYLNEGTILVPSFTYSATKGEPFDVLKTPSDVGLFSEKFRMLDGVQRSEHPIFSICALGKYADKFVHSRQDDCFGEGTLFDQLYSSNVKILTMGCAFERVTFAHYVEQRLNVPYRYFKNFSAEIMYLGKSTQLDVRYYVRKLELDTELDLTKLEHNALAQSLIRREHFGRFLARAILAKDFFDIASELILDDESSLIKGRLLV